MAGWLAGWRLAACGWLAGWLVGWLAGCIDGWLAGWLAMWDKALCTKYYVVVSSTWYHAFGPESLIQSTWYQVVCIEFFACYDD